MLRTDQYKYVSYSWGQYREQVFDLVDDPGEMVNPAVDQRDGAVLSEHRERLNRHCRDTDDDFRAGAVRLAGLS